MFKFIKELFDIENYLPITFTEEEKKQVSYKSESEEDSSYYDHTVIVALS
jgi:hypothetical protein